MRGTRERGDAREAMAPRRSRGETPWESRPGSRLSVAWVNAAKSRLDGRRLACCPWPSLYIEAAA